MDRHSGRARERVEALLVGCAVLLGAICAGCGGGGGASRALNAAGDVGAASKGKIAFESGRDGDPEIFVMNADGTGVKRLTRNTADDSEPSWRPVP